MSSRVRYIIQEADGHDWKVISSGDTLEDIVQTWETLVLPVLRMNGDMMRSTHHVQTSFGVIRQFRIARATPNTITVIDPGEHSQRHRVAFREARLGGLLR